MVEVVASVEVDEEEEEHSAREEVSFRSVQLLPPKLRH